MANIITRTLNLYTYKVVKLDTNTLTITVIEEKTTPVKMGKREFDKWNAAHVMNGNVVLPPEEKTVTVGMTVEDFYNYGTVITDDKEEITTIDERIYAEVEKRVHVIAGSYNE